MKNGTLAALCVIVAGPCTATAADFDAAAEVGAVYSDNIRRTASDERSETTLMAAGEFALREQTRRLDADVRGTVGYQEYLNDTFDREFLGSVDAAAAFGIIPERLVWSLHDNFGQTLQDVFAVDTPENREYVNYLSTGPDLAMRFGSGNHLRIGARYSRVDYESSPFDNDRVGGVVGVSHDLSAAAALSLLGQRESVKFAERDAARDFDRDAAFARYEMRGARTRIQLDGGANRVRIDGDSFSGTLLRLEVSRDMGRYSTASVHVGRELTESGNALRFQQNLRDISLDSLSVPNSPDPYTVKYATLRWDASGRRTRLFASASIFRETFVSVLGQDRSRRDFEVGAARDRGPRLSLRASGAYRREKRLDGPDEFRELAVRAGLNWRIEGHLYLDFALEHSDRDSSGIATEYRENRATVRVRFGAPMVRGVSSI
jgi:hypothetical protein